MELLQAMKILLHICSCFKRGLISRLSEHDAIDLHLSNLGGSSIMKFCALRQGFDVWISFVEYAIYSLIFMDALFWCFS